MSSLKLLELLFDSTSITIVVSSRPSLSHRQWGKEVIFITIYMFDTYQPIICFFLSCLFTFLTVTSVETATAAEDAAAGGCTFYGLFWISQFETENGSLRKIVASTAKLEKDFLVRVQTQSIAGSRYASHTMFFYCVCVMERQREKER